VGSTLYVTGNNAANTFVISRTPGGVVLVNNNRVPTPTGWLRMGQLSKIVANGKGGDDTITLDETNGPLRKAVLRGGDGNDTLKGGAAVDQLLGGAGNDTLTGAGGNDQLTGEDGDDTLVWNAGDGSDIIEGGAGTDALQFNGSAGAEIFAASANGNRVK